jgi:GntR family transcriptional regulator / MocR family aminotransferase
MPSARRPRGFSPEIQLVAGGRDAGPLHVRLYRQLREHILAGALGPGARLPSARTLAADLGISRNTVETAVGQLVAEGFVERRVGAGTVVAESLAEAAPFRRRTTLDPPAPADRCPPSGLSKRGAETVRLGLLEIKSDLNTGTCATNVERFPRDLWFRQLARSARRGGTELLVPAPVHGLPELRRQIAEHARLTRGLRCQAEQVVVVNSTQQALDLCSRLLLDPGDRVLVEDPGYLSARAVFQGAGAKLGTVPVDAEGLVADRLLGDGTARLLYLTPSHQFPLGVTLSLSRRLAVLAWAAEHAGFVIEDDYDSEFRYDGRPLAALSGLDTAGRVIYLGTYNKVLFPGLRLAYLILPPMLVDAFAAARRLADGTSPPLPQAALAEFLATGQFAAYLRQARTYYAGCRDVLLAALGAELGEGLALGPSGAGLQVALHLPAEVDDLDLVRSLPRLALGVAPLSKYYLGEPRRGLLVSYGATPPERIASDGALLARALGFGRTEVRPSGRPIRGTEASRQPLKAGRRKSDWHPWASANGPR